jgi:hypothetical protein
MSDEVTVRDLIEYLKGLDQEALIVSPDKITISAMHVQGIKFTPLKRRHLYANSGWLAEDNKFFTDAQMGGANSNGWYRPSKYSRKAYIIDTIGVDDES